MSFKKKGLLRRHANNVSVAATDVAVSTSSPEFTNLCHTLLQKVDDLALLISDTQHSVIAQLKEAALSLVARAQQVQEGQLESDSLDVPLRLVVRLAGSVEEEKSLQSIAMTDSSNQLFEKSLGESVDVLMQEYRRFVVLVREMAMGDHTKAEYVAACKSLLQKTKDVDLAESRATGVNVATYFEKLREEVKEGIRASKEFINSKYQGSQLEELRGERDHRIEHLVDAIKDAAGLGKRKKVSPRDEPTVPVMLLSPRQREMAKPGIESNMARAMVNQYHSPREEPAPEPKEEKKTRRGSIKNPRRASKKGEKEAEEQLSPRPLVGHGPPLLVSAKKQTQVEAEVKLKLALAEQNKRGGSKRVSMLSPRKKKKGKDDPSQSYRKYLAKDKEKKATYNANVRDARLLEGLGEYDKAIFTYQAALAQTPPGTNPKLESKIASLQRKQGLKEEGILE